MKIPLAPVIQATVTNSDEESSHTGTHVLTFQTRVTNEQVDNGQIPQVVDLMRETMQEIIENAG